MTEHSPARHPDVTTLVVTWRGREFIDACLDAVAASRCGRTLVIDNASDDGTAGRLARRSGIDVVRLGRNLGFAGGVAAGLERVATPFVALVNDDAVVAPDWLDEAMRAFDDREVAAANAKLLLPDGRINNAGSSVDVHGGGVDRGLLEPDGPEWNRPTDLASFCGGAVVLRLDAVRAVGGFDPTFFLYYEDTDLAFRLRRAGHRIRYVPKARVVHRHSASTDQSSTSFHRFNERNRLLFLLRQFPAGTIAHELVRYVRGTVGFAVDRLRGRRPAHPSQRVRLRLRVMADVAAMLPASLRARRQIAALGPFPGLDPTP